MRISALRNICLFIVALCVPLPVFAQHQAVWLGWNNTRTGDDGSLIDPGTADPIVDMISGERAKEYVERISQFHRLRGGGPGSGYNEAVDYVVSELDEFGLDDVHVERFLSDGIATYLRWQSPVGWRVKGARLCLTEPRNQLLADFSHTAVSLMAYSNGGEAEADVVYVGDGKSDENYAGLDVEGKIVFATGGNGSGVHREAVLERGALGVVVGPSGRLTRMDYPDLVELSRLSFGGDEREDAGWGFSLTRRQTESLIRMVESGQEIRMRAEVEAELFDGEMPVVSALIRGRTFPDEEILVMGHLDHYKPGANDNASGSAGMMEMAKVLSDLISSGKIMRPHRSIRFLWLPENNGAAAYADAHPEVGEHTLVGINLDMIGEDVVATRGNLNLTRPPYSNPSYLGDVVASMFQWVDGLDLFSERGSRIRMNYRDMGYAGGSDHVIFNDRTVGVSSMMLGHSDVFHHTSYDTPDKCDPTEMRRVITAATMAAYVIANADDRMARKIAFLTAESALGRIQDRTERSSRTIEQALQSESPASNGAYAYRNALEYARILTDVEQEAILSARRLSTAPAVASFIEQLAATLDDDLESEEERMGLVYEELCRSLGVQAREYSLNAAEIQASRIVPSREFRGPLPSYYLATQLGDDFDWYRENATAIGGNMGAKTFEIANFADGSRSVLEIRDIISAQFTETDLEFVVRYVEDMRRVGLFSY